MSELFKNYPQPDEYIPNNRPKCHKPMKIDIMSGETSIHTFEIPFNVEKDCSSFEVIYKLGVEIVLIKHFLDCSLTSEEDKSIITCVLSSEETKLFANNLLDTNVQIKFIMKDNSVIYSDIYKVYVKDSLESDLSGD